MLAMKRMKAVDAPTNIKDQQKAKEFKELKNNINEEKGKVISFHSNIQFQTRCVTRDFWGQGRFLQIRAQILVVLKVKVKCKH